MTTFSAVVTTGIYCRPGCGAKPLAENVRTFELAATAEAAGFRACLRCRPYRVASPLGSHAPELVCRAVQLIIDGALDDGTEAALGGRLAISPRHLRRMFNDHLGATPDQLARSRRAHFARRLLDDSELTVADVAFASGFGSLRQFNRDMRGVFRASPSELRGRRRRADRLAADGGLMMRLPFQQPFEWDSIVAFLADRAVPGVESVEDLVYRRTITLDGDAGVLEVHPGSEDHLLLRAHLPHWEGLIHVAERAGRMVGVDGDAGTAMAHLAGDPTIGTLVTARPGIRVPSAWGALEAAVHAIVAQHCSLARARTRMGALVRHCGQPVPGLTHGLTHLFPSADVLADEDLAAIDDLPRTTVGAIRALAASVAAGSVMLDSSAGLVDLVGSLTAIPGIGATAAHQIALRLGHRDAFPESDPQVRRALRILGATGPAEEIASRWRPWRAVAATYLITHAASVHAHLPGQPCERRPGLAGSPTGRRAGDVTAQSC
jgi:AraC family transcriptional regulator, regulatory protein of adaptative response / DNA-3-methyladenine glycosylase II